MKNNFGLICKAQCTKLILTFSRTLFSNSYVCTEEYEILYIHTHTHTLSALHRRIFGQGYITEYSPLERVEPEEILKNAVELKMVQRKVKRCSLRNNFSWFLSIQELELQNKTK